MLSLNSSERGRETHVVACGLGAPGGYEMLRDSGADLIRLSGHTSIRHGNACIVHDKLMIMSSSRKERQSRG